MPRGAISAIRAAAIDARSTREAARDELGAFATAESVAIVLVEGRGALASWTGLARPRISTGAASSNTATKVEPHPEQFQSRPASPDRGMRSGSVTSQTKQRSNEFVLIVLVVAGIIREADHCRGIMPPPGRMDVPSSLLADGLTFRQKNSICNGYVNFSASCFMLAALRHVATPYR